MPTKTIELTLNDDEWLLFVAALALYASEAFKKGAERQFSMAVVLIALLRRKLYA